MKSKPHIFLDSNIFFTDPFQKNRFNSALINLSNMSEINLYITDVVYSESIGNFKKLLSERLGNYNKALYSLNNLTFFGHDSEIKDAEFYFKNFETHLEELTSSLIQIIPFNPSDIKEVVNRSINLTKPFSKNKQEFRDCMIWLTLKRYILENKLSNCYFISANTKDFYDDSGVDLHPILKNDIPNLIPFKSTKELILKVGNLNKLVVEEELDIWSHLNISESDIENIMWEDIYEALSNKIELEVKKKYEGELFHNSKIDKVQTSFIDVISVKNKSYKIVQDFSFFSCDFELELPTLFSNYEELIADYISEEYIVKIRGRVHFTIRPNEKAQFNDIDNLEFET